MSEVTNIDELLLKSRKYDELVEYIKSLGCQADIDLLRIIGPDPADIVAYEKNKELKDKTWEANVSKFGEDFANWPKNERLLYRIVSIDIDNYERIYCKDKGASSWLKQ